MPHAIQDRYRIEQPPIGQGGMGVVYRAYDNLLKKPVALKTVKGEVDHACLAMFEREWTMLARLCHPNIVDVFDIGEFVEGDLRKPYFVMPLLPGATLETLIKTASDRLTPERVVDIITQAARGLQAAHDGGLVHRDLKPSNIFVLDDDTVKIIDFGVVHLAGSETQTGVRGTLQYMSPEQVDLKPATARSDIFSLGVVCYEALSGRKPFDRPTVEKMLEAIRFHVPPPLSELSSAINEQISRTVHKSLAKQPYHRFSSAREFAEVLRRALRNEYIDLFDVGRIQPRIQRVKRALSDGDYQFASELLSELEAEGHIDSELSLLRIQTEQATRTKTVHQLIEGARARMDEDEYVLAAQKVQSALDLDGANADALELKGEIERRRSEQQNGKWLQIAREHLDNHLLVKARQAVEEVLKADRSHVEARTLLSRIAEEEQRIALLRQQKQQLYDSALRSYRDGEISSAIQKLEKVLDLGKQGLGEPQTDAHALSLYNQIRSERDELSNAYDEGKSALDSRQFERALEICRDVLSRRPGDPLFQSLKIEIEDRQRQENSAAVAQYHSRIEAEPDLERKFSLAKEAATRFPNERTFEQALKLTRERRDLVNSIVTRARHYESQGQFAEACNQWDILRNIYGQYPGLDHELRRLNRRREEHLHDAAKSIWADKIDKAIIAGEYTQAFETASLALEEFPEDAELIYLRDQAAQAMERAVQALALLDEGQHLATSGDLAESIDRLRKARELDGRNATVLAALSSILVEHARAVAATDWRAALPYIDEALDINPSDPGAASVSSLVEDLRRREAVEQCLMESRELQTIGRLARAIDHLDQGLSLFPNEPRLLKLRGTLAAALSSEADDRPSRQETISTEQSLRLAAAASAARGSSYAGKSGYDQTVMIPDGPGQTDREVDAGRSSSPDTGRFAAHTSQAPEDIQNARASRAAMQAIWESRQPRGWRQKLAPVEPWLKPVAAAGVVVACGLALVFITRLSGERSTPVQATSGSLKGASRSQSSSTTVKTAAPQGAAKTPGSGVLSDTSSGPDAASPSHAKPSGLTLVLFESNPMNAKVVADNKDECLTPCFLPLGAGRHTYSISADDHRTTRGIIQVPSESRTFINLPDDKLPVTISTDPKGATIFIDGHEIGPSPLRLHLKIGQHQLRIEKGDYRHDEPLEVVDNSLNTYFYRLPYKQR